MDLKYRPKVGEYIRVKRDVERLRYGANIFLNDLKNFGGIVEEVDYRTVLIRVENRSSTMIYVSRLEIEPFYRVEEEELWI